MSTIHRVDHGPAQQVSFASLSDGSRASIRLALPGDVDRQRAFFRALSPEARYRRFMTPLRELPDGLAERFAHADRHRHLALLAEVHADGGTTMIGEARYIADAYELGTCTFAIAVADDRQRLGLGRALLERLEREAAAAGLCRITGETLATSRAMIALATGMGYRVAYEGADPTLVRLEKRLVTPSAAPLAA